MTGPLRILIPSDGSEPSRRAVGHALGLARRGLLVDIHVLNVQPAVRGGAASLLSQHDLESFHRDEGMKVLADTRREIEAAGLVPHAHVSVGVAGETIVAFAERLECDQIVMGTRGQGLVGNLLLGSVAKHVVANTTRPVTLLR